MVHPLRYSGYYRKTLHAIYRVVPNFVAQFGTSEKIIMDAWKPYKYADEPVLQSNKRGTVSFARSGKETRDTQIFINLKDNARLDSTNYNGVKGFPVIATVTQGMNYVDSLYNGYGNKPMAKMDSLKFANVRERYKDFPQLDYIQKAYLIR